jgi:hypothetical protein
MLIGVAFLLLASLAFVAGGSATRLRELHLRLTWAPVVAVGAQVVIISIVDVGAAAAPIHVASYVLLAAFAVANRDHPGVIVLCAGLILNAVAILANGGVMPADADALARTGRTLDHEFENSAAVEDARLPWLGDVFAWPEPMPLANVFSVGDVLIVLGGALVVHQVTGSRLYPRRATARGQSAPS